MIVHSVDVTTELGRCVYGLPKHVFGSGESDLDFESPC